MKRFKLTGLLEDITIIPRDQTTLDYSSIAETGIMSFCISSNPEKLLVSDMYTVQYRSNIVSKDPKGLYPDNCNLYFTEDGNYILVYKDSDTYGVWCDDRNQKECGYIFCIRTLEDYTAGADYDNYRIREFILKEVTEFDKDRNCTVAYTTKTKSKLFELLMELAKKVGYPEHKGFMISADYGDELYSEFLTIIHSL